MRKKSNKFPVCESCGRDERGGTDPSWKPPAISLKTQLKEAIQALTMERAALLKEQADHRKTDEVWAGVLKDKRIQTQNLVAERTETITSMGRDIVYLKEQNKELTRRLDYETRRAAKALEVADNAAIGTACIARITSRLSGVVDTLETRVGQPNDALGKLSSPRALREKELARREAWVSAHYPEAVAQDVFDNLTEPPGTWAWHKDRSEDWNKRAEARWEVLVAEFMSAGERGVHG